MVLSRIRVFSDCLEKLRSLVTELDRSLGDVMCAVVFGSLARGRLEFDDADLFVLTRDSHGVEYPLMLGPLLVEVHLVSLKELNNEGSWKLLYGVWRDGLIIHGDASPIYDRLKPFLKGHGWKAESLRIERARLGLENAGKKLEDCRRAEREAERSYHLSVACEHAFHAAVVATEELLVKEGYPIPGDHAERFNVLEELSAKDRRLASLKLKERLGSLFMNLHVKGYYRAAISIEEAEAYINKAEEYVKDIENLTN